MAKSAGNCLTHRVVYEPVSQENVTSRTEFIYSLIFSYIRNGDNFEDIIIKL